MDILEDLSLPQRVVLVGLTALEGDGGTPAQVNVITRRARAEVDGIDDIGKLTEAEVDRTMNVLEAAEVVTVPSTGDSSPVGKGRPAYELAVDVDTVAAELAEDDRLTSVVDKPEAY